jgi:hypothetical protein
MKVQSAGTVRASISFPPDIYESLEELAKRKKCHWRGWCVTRRKGIWPSELPTATVLQEKEWIGRRRTINDTNDSQF